MKTRILLLIALPSLALSAVAAEKKGSEKEVFSGETKEFVFKKTPEAELKIFVHYPTGWKSTDKRPAVIFFFGGGWSKGTPEQFRPQAEYFASRGLVTARADYRIKTTHNTKPDKCVEDAKTAMRWLRSRAKEFGIDPNRLVAAGGSAGGHLAACAGTLDVPNAPDDDLSVSSKANAMLLWNPVVDLEKLPEARLVQWIGTNMAQTISPARFVSAKTPPAIMFFGTKDPLLSQADHMIEASRKFGNRVELYTAEGKPHGFFNRSPWLEATMRQADEFLISLGYLKGKPTVEVPAGAKLEKKF